MAEGHTTLQDLEILSSQLKSNILVVGNSAIARNGLAYDMYPISIYTNCRPLNGIHVDNLVYEAYHFNDLYLCKEIKPNVFLPTPEKAIFDAIVWLPENMNEGTLIEALQTYQEWYGNSGKQKLYEVADHYGVPYEFIDYWWKEAEEESDMSMG